MGNPRNVVDFTGIDQTRVTYLIDNSTIVFDRTKSGGSAGVGLAVRFNDDKTVALVADGEIIEGRLELVEADNKAVVTVDGFVQLPAGQGATVTQGLKQVGALGAASAKGFIRDAATDTERANSKAVAVDATDLTNCFVRMT
jgi:hypothetical protein